MIKKSLCIFLSAVLLMFCLVPAQPPAEAVALTLTAGASILATLLISAGVTVGSIVTIRSMIDALNAHEGALKDHGGQTYEEWANVIYHDFTNGNNPDRQPDSDNPDKIPFVPGDENMIRDFFNDVRELFGGKTGENSINVPDLSKSNYQDVLVLNSIDGLTSEQLFYLAPYSSFDIVTLIRNGYTFDYSCYIDADTPFFCTMKLNDSIIQDKDCDPVIRMTVKLSQKYTPYTNCEFRFGFYLTNVDSITYINPFLVGRGLDSDGYVQYSSNTTLSSYHGQFQADFELLQPSTIEYPYTFDPYYSISSFRDALLDQLQHGGIYLPNIEYQNDQQLGLSQQQLAQQIGISNKLDDIKESMPAPETDFKIPEMPSISDKFPFCVPFDLIALVQAFNAPPKDPVWEIPFKMSNIGIDEKITLDLTQFEPVTNVLRVTTTIFFILGLVVVTRKMIKG